MTVLGLKEVLEHPSASGMTGHLRWRGEVQQTRPQCFGKQDLSQLRDRGMSTEQHTILSLKEEQISVSHCGKDGLAEVVCLLCGADL